MPARFAVTASSFRSAHTGPSSAVAEAGSEERSILESLSNNVIARGLAYEDKQLLLNS